MKIGWLEILPFDEYEAKGLPLTVSLAGYFGDIEKKKGTLSPHAPKHLMTHRNCVIDDAVGWVRHNCQIAPGSSGSPLFVTDKNGNPKVVGMVAKSPFPDGRALGVNLTGLDDLLSEYYTAESIAAYQAVYGSNPATSGSKLEPSSRSTKQRSKM